jgi:VanZ family protein
MRHFSQVAAWLLAFAIVALSIVSPAYRPVTNIPRPLEHFSIFFLTGLAFAHGYPYRYSVQSVALLVFAGAVELVQKWIPGRHARLSDFIAGVLGLGLGACLVYALRRLARRG